MREIISATKNSRSSKEKLKEKEKKKKHTAGFIYHKHTTIKSGYKSLKIR